MKSSHIQKINDYNSCIVVNTSPSRQHQNKEYSLNLEVYTRDSIRQNPQAGKLAALDGAVKDLRGAIGATRNDQDTLRLLISNLFVAWCTVGNPFVTTPMARNAYSPGARLHKLHLRRDRVRKLVSALEEHEYIEVHRGFYDVQKRNGRCSRIRTAERLRHVFVRHALTIKSLHRSSPLVILRDEQKNITTGKLAAQANQFYPAILKVNVTLALAEVRLVIDEKAFINTYVLATEGRKAPCNPPNPCAVLLYRVFNKTFELGGRFYGPWWQGVPKKLRKDITIDGYPVVELDYKSLHPRILYLKEGVALAGDPYTLPGYGTPFRPIIKLLLNCGINAESSQKAMKAVRNEIANNFSLLGKFKECLTNTWLQNAWSAMCRYHSAIVQYLGTGYGLKLQRVDSDMAEYIMLQMGRKGIPVLCIHDSFVAPNVHEQTLRAVMIDASRKYAGGCIPVENKMPENSLPNTYFNFNSGWLHKNTAE